MTRAAPLLVLLAACSTRAEVLPPVDAAQDVGHVDADADAGADAAPAPDSGTPPELGGSVCDQQDNCNACARCAGVFMQPCNSAALACQADSACMDAGTCALACADHDTACFDACRERYSTSYDTFAAWYVCWRCTACPIDCGRPADGCTMLM